MNPLLKFLWIFPLILADLAWAQPAPGYYQEGLASYNLGQYDQAITQLKMAISANPQSWQAYQVLGEAYYKKGDNTDAVNALRTSLQLHPDNPALRTFTDQISPAPTSASLPASAPLTSVGMSVKSAVSPNSRSGNVFVNLYGAFEEPFDGGLASAEKAYKNAGPTGFTNNYNTYEPEIFGFGMEFGFEWDKENALSACLYGSIVTSGPSFDAGGSTDSPPYPSADDSIFGGISEVSLRYYRYLPEGSDRWFGFASADYYDLDLTYGTNQGTENPSYVGTVMNAPSLLGSGLGGTLGVGRQFLLFGFLNMEASVAFKYVNVPQVTGPYTVATYSGGSLGSITSGTGTLVTLSNGSIVLVDQKNVGSAKITNFDMSGVEGRAAFNIWF